MGFDGLIYRMGGADVVYGKVASVTDGDTISVEVFGQGRPIRLIGVDTPETVAPGQPVGCFGKEAAAYTKKTLAKKLVSHHEIALPTGGPAIGPFYDPC